MANKYLDDVGLTHLWTKIKDYVSANSNKYTLPVATTSILGGVKLGSDTVQTVAAASVSTTASRTYAIQKNNNGQLVVNVPWTNTLPSADAADIVYWDTAQGTQLVIDLLSLFQTNSENSISRSPISYENNFFGNLLSQIRAGRKIAGIYIYNDTTVSGSQLIAYLQLSLVNGDTVTFTVYNLEFANEPTYGYIVEWTNGGNIFIAKTRLATQTDLNSYAKDNTVVHNNKDEWSINGVKQWNGIAYFQNSVTCNNILNTTKGINNDGIFQGGALDLHPESKVAYLPFYMNELAYLIEKGGSCTITGITSDTTTTNAALFDGTSGYSYFRVANTTDVVTILIKCHKAFYWNNCFGISFGAAAFRAKDIKVELGYATEIGGDPTDDMWKTVAEVTDYASGLFFKRPVTGPENPNKGGVPWNTIKITLTNFNGLDFRIAGIFTADTASEGLNTTLLGKKGGEMFGSITPYKDSTYSLGSDTKTWKQLHARNIYTTNLYTKNSLFTTDGGSLGTSDKKWWNLHAVNIYENGTNISEKYLTIDTASTTYAKKANGIYYVVGTGTTAGTWLGSSDEITEYYDGLTIAYKLNIAGGSSTTTLNINGLGAKTVYLRGTTKLTTHYATDTVIIAVYTTVDGTGRWYVNDYDANSYAYVRQYTTTTAAEYPILFAYETTLPSSYDTKYVRKATGFTYNPSTKLLTIPTGGGIQPAQGVIFGANDADQACIISPERKLCIGTDELDGDYMEYKFPDNKAGTIALLEDIPTVTKKYLHTIHITASTSSSGTTTVHMTLSFVNSVATAYTGVRGSLDTALYSAGFNSDTKLCVASGSFVSGSNVCTIKGARGSSSSGLYVYGTYSTYSGGTHTLTSTSVVVGMYSATINDVVTEI